MKTPNYHDFYQKALIPIGFNDLAELEKSDATYSSAHATHWLIAVEGEQLPQPKIYFHWKVSIYPANAEGDFNWKKPYYCSPKMACIDDAIRLAGTAVRSGQVDQLSSVTLQEKIS